MSLGFSRDLYCRLTYDSIGANLAPCPALASAGVRQQLSELRIRHRLLIIRRQAVHHVFRERRGKSTAWNIYAISLYSFSIVPLSRRALVWGSHACTAGEDDELEVLA